MIHQEVAAKLDAFLSAHKQCIDALLDESNHLKISMPDWPEFKMTKKSDLEKAITAINDLDLRPGEDARSTRFYPGVIEADKQTIDLFCSLNESKDQFKEAMKKLKVESPRNHRLFNEFVKTGNLDTREERYGRTFGPISLNHTYRKFSILTDRPVSISYSWSCRSSSLVVVTKKEAIRALEELNEELPIHLQLQLRNLAGVNDSEPLVKMIPSPAGAKVNVVFENGDRSTIKPALPIIVPEGSTPIRMKFLTEEDVRRKSSRLRRSDTKIEEFPIAPSIHLYRYKEGHRGSR